MLASLASCVAPTPPPAPAPEPAPLPPPPPQAPPVAWEDAPLSPGTWLYRAGVASFGPAGAAPSATLVCDAASRTVTLAVAHVGAGEAIDVTTSYGKRRLPAIAGAGNMTARLAANDGLLDWMAYSRGRFRIDVAGAGPLTLPAWPEIARTIEDCRK